MDRTVIGMRVGMATTAAIEPGPTGTTFFLGQDMGLAKLPANFPPFNPVKNTPDLIPVPADKLVAGIQVAVRRHRKVFMPGAATAQAFDKTRPVLQVHVEMEKLKTTAGRLATQILRRQQVILTIQFRQMRLSQFVRLTLANHRLHRQAQKSLIGQIQNIGGKIRIIGRISSPGKIVLSLP